MQASEKALELEFCTFDDIIDGYTALKKKRLGIEPPTTKRKYKRRSKPSDCSVESETNRVVVTVEKTKIDNLNHIIIEEESNPNSKVIISLPSAVREAGIGMYHIGI